MANQFTSGWTAKEEAVLLNGGIPEGRTRSQCRMHRSVMRKRGITFSECKKGFKDFTPEMDVVIMSGKCPAGVPQYAAQMRRKWLQENFVDVGWGDIVGKQKIVSP